MSQNMQKNAMKFLKKLEKMIVKLSREEKSLREVAKTTKQNQSSYY